MAYIRQRLLLKSKLHSIRLKEENELFKTIPSVVFVLVLLGQVNESKVED